MTPTMRFPAALLAIVGAVGAWSYVEPLDRLTWWLEAIPAIVAAALLTATYRRFRFTDLAYGLIAVHAVILLVGAHYTYAEVPLFDWIRDALGLARNHYDRLGHVAQGFVPAIVARELLLRTSPLRPGGWLFALVVLACLGISGAYELIEWLAAELTGESATAFLGTQGDVWDTQKDMALALTGALAALLTLGSVHDRALRRVAASGTG